jgi:hypothetical protein
MITMSRRSLRSLRVAASIGRWLLWAAAIAGVAASLRFLIDPPRPIMRHATAPRDDRALVATAVAFARAYLSLDGARPDAARGRLADVIGPDAAATLVADAPPTVHQRVRSVDVVGDRPAAGGTRVVTVVADTDRSGPVHLAVTMQRRADGSLRAVGAPALVGGPLVGGAALDPDQRRPEVDEPALEDVCRRALENYLAGAGRNLAADLSAHARVTLPDVPLRLERVRGLRWIVVGGTVAAAVEVSDRDGVRYALRYELDVVRAEDRWEIAAIGTDPTA